VASYFNMNEKLKTLKDEVAVRYYRPLNVNDHIYYHVLRIHRAINRQQVKKEAFSERCQSIECHPLPTTMSSSAFPLLCELQLLNCHSPKITTECRLCSLFLSVLDLTSLPNPGVP
jgi:hypothetical protein